MLGWAKVYGLRVNIRIPYERTHDKNGTKTLLLTGGNVVISSKGGIPKNWEKLFCFYY
jgi:hypothetical protein